MVHAMCNIAQLFYFEKVSSRGIFWKAKIPRWGILVIDPGPPAMQRGRLFDFAKDAASLPGQGLVISD